ncbi:MAG: glycosyltransferase family 4 protein [Candidatus Omnitrophica bacterium]|nr:glycosyltransferase family 4 protein [Candidatus Omnitrophota bacterium]
MKKIKLAQVITRMDWGGSSDIVRILCERLDPNVYDITLICGPTENPSDRTKRFFESYKNKIITLRRLKRNINIYGDVRSLFDLYKIFKREHFDIVHTHTAKSGFTGRIAAKMAGVQVVIHTPHGNNFYGYLNSLWTPAVILLERFASRFSDKLIVLTNIERQDLIRYNICKSELIEIVHSGIEIENFSDLSVDPKEKRRIYGIDAECTLVGMVARLERVKGPHYFIEAAKIINEELPDVKFLVTGDGSLKGELVDYSKKLNLDRKIVFTGWTNDIPGVLSMLDLLVVPSLNEAVGRTILEAGVLSKAVVATSVGGIPDVIRDGETGILVPPEDPRKIAEAVVDLLRDNRKAREIGRNAREWVQGHYNVDTMIKEIHNQYMSFYSI